MAENHSNGPPANVSASELYLSLTALPFPHDIVDFPMKEPVMGASIGKVAIVPLGVQELMVCQKVAADYASNLTKEKPKAGEESLAYRDAYGTESIVQILWRALKDPNDKKFEKPAFPAPAVLRIKPFTSDMLHVLLSMYMRTCATKGPIVATMTVDEMEAWLDRLEEGGAAHPLDLLSPAMLSDLLTHSVARSKALRTASSSRGSQPAAPGDGEPLLQIPSPDSPPIIPDADDPEAPEADVIDIPKP